MRVSFERRAWKVDRDEISNGSMKQEKAYERKKKGKKKEEEKKGNEERHTHFACMTSVTENTHPGHVCRSIYSKELQVHPRNIKYSKSGRE